MEAILAPVVWLVSFFLWIVVCIIAFAVAFAIPIILLQIGWMFFKKQLIGAGVKEEWVKKVTDWYWKALIRYFKFWLFDLPSFLHRAGRSGRRKLKRHLRRKHPVWHRRLHRFKIV